MKKILIITMASSFGLIACSTTETSRTIQSPQVTAATATTKYTGVKTPISIGKFDNRSSYMRGVFSDNVDRLGGQAKTILETHLQQTGYFSVLNRDNLSEIKQEVGYSNTAQSIKGARYVITGDVSEFGRKEVGDQQLFGILGRGKQQVAYAKVNLNIVDVKTSEVVHSVQGAGEYVLGAREVLGFGTTASYDSTLNGKVLDLAVREAVNNLVTDIQNNRWSIQ
ncbi:CsgG/HfaB family protein [Acinetobacter baumannii]|jgi:curli biogenesis system outer membrane secretion channel CsgG|uniref:CsgG/HfaB family protein n=1 Tax=Acinetobacter TaxID=469 RepID=UPI0002BB702C|nr:CsgG/HfaB family protein [Acinetobacter baumannii]EHU1307009.1 CsgG/HfaB family protein [Acinetobacter baumannii]EHU1428745.1 CsgG/HfaB family protein [Acinetobacter baumannii]EHU2159837.1 CsgG/HfaB family protein [Acinetobacter baumannii]EHU2363216.1 CsgG/HfaB family protein [Acinetobacter baumannii]EHU2441627.1 CsgG/HfaB family protein [Acinetobacter baumannii]